MKTQNEKKSFNWAMGASVVFALSSVPFMVSAILADNNRLFEGMAWCLGLAGVWGIWGELWAWRRGSRLL
ncbi:MAG: hypothetical protein N3J91_06985 [Verrucomicrobiae bacterium]|nr:hypothetical protein [Verrucomicrobiae bacterium]